MHTLSSRRMEPNQWTIRTVKNHWSISCNRSLFLFVSLWRRNNIWQILLQCAFYWKISENSWTWGAVSETYIRLDYSLSFFNCRGKTMYIYIGLSSILEFYFFFMSCRYSARRVLIARLAIFYEGYELQTRIEFGAEISAATWYIINTSDTCKDLYSPCVRRPAGGNY